MNESERQRVEQHRLKTQRENTTMPPLNVAYILLYFPRLTETFVAEEIRSIRLQGTDVRIISLLEPGVEPVQPFVQQLLPCTWYAPSFLTPAAWKAQFHFLRKSWRLYLSLLVTLLRPPYARPPLMSLLKRLLVFFKAVSAAYYLEGSGVQLLHTHFAWLSGAATWICARLLDLPFTVTVHAYDIYSHKNDLLPLVSQEADRVIAISEFNRSHVEALRTCLPEAISMIHCGIDLTKFEGQPFVERARHNGDPVRILSVGSLVPKKGHRYLIEACHLLHERGMDFTCTIIGGGPDESVLRQLISAWDLQNQVELRGARPQSEIIAAYHQHDVFVLASIVAPNGDRDGIPVVLMEAGKVGLPLISTAVSGIPELVRQDQTGWLVPPGDATALADAIAALATDPATRARLGCNARVLVEEQFSIECNTLRLAALFHDTYQQWNHGIPDTHHD